MSGFKILRKRLQTNFALFIFILTHQKRKHQTVKGLSNRSNKSNNVPNIIYYNCLGTYPCTPIINLLLVHADLQSHKIYCYLKLHTYVNPISINYIVHMTVIVVGGVGNDIIIYHINVLFIYKTNLL